MANTIQVKRGPTASLPQLQPGEFGFCTDSGAERLYIGNGAGNANIRIALYNDFNTFLKLTDTPASYSGQAGKYVKVKATEDGLEFAAGAGASTFLDLTDTPSSYTGQSLKLVRVNSAENALEFVAVGTYFEDTPTNGELNKGPTSNWAYDHNAANTGVHGAGSNTLLHSGSVIDGGTWS